MKRFLLLIAIGLQIFADDINKELDEKIAFEKYDEVVDIVDLRLLEETNRKRIATLNYYKAEALYHLGELQDSFEILKDLVDNYNYEIDYEKVLNLQFEISNARYEKSGSSSFFGTSKEAIEFYEELIRQAPYSRGAATSMLRIGMLQQDDDDDPAAMITYRKVIVNYPDSDEAGYARIYIAQYNILQMRGVYGDLELMREAKTQLRLFLMQYKKHPLLEEAKEQLKELEEVEAERTYRLAEFYLDPVHLRKEAAKRYLYRVIVNFSNTEVVSDAEALLKSIDEGNHEEEIKNLKNNKRKSDKLQKQLAKEILPPSTPEATDRSQRRIIVRPEDSKGKYLTPVEDLGLDLKPLEPEPSTKPAIDTEEK